MARPVDILDERESLRGPFVLSVGAHVGLGVFMGLSSWLAASGPKFGVENPGAGSMTVNVVSSIPLQQRTGLQNPVARDTKSNLPAPPKEVKVEQAKPEPEAIALKSKDAKKPREQEKKAAQAQKYRNPEADRPNQLYSTQGQAAVSQIFSQAPGAGGVGTGPASSLGTRFGGYEALLRQRVAEKWNTGDVDSRTKTAPIAIVIFELLRNGSVRNVKVLQSSGISALDYSAQRAVFDAAPFPPLPAGFERDSARVELWFELKR